MATPGRPFRCEVLEPEGRVCDLQATSAVVPSAGGSMGILYGRAPVVVRLAVGGVLTIEEVSGTRREFFVSGGFAQMRGAHLTVLAEECTAAENLDREEVWEELQTARRLPATTPEMADEKQAVLTALRSKFRLVQRYLKQREQSPP